MLWSFIVARCGGKYDVWGKEEMEKAWRELGGVEGEENVNVKRGVRDTLAKMEEFWSEERSGQVAKGYTNPEFCESSYPFAPWL